MFIAPFESTNLQKFILFNKKKHFFYNKWSALIQFGRFFQMGTELQIEDIVNINHILNYSADLILSMQQKKKKNTNSNNAQNTLFLVSASSSSICHQQQCKHNLNLK